MFVSPQGLLVDQVFQAHLVSQVLWVPKVSQVPSWCPSLPCSGWITEVQVLESLTAPTPCPRPVQGLWPRKGPPQRSQGSGLGLDLAAWWIWGHISIYFQWLLYVVPKWVDGSGNQKSDNFLT